MRQSALVPAVVAVAAFSLTACGSSSHKAAASSAATVASSSSTSSSTSTPAPQVTQTVTQTPPPTVTQTVSAAPAPAAGGGGTNGCSYEGKGIVLSNLSCGFAQNVIEAYESGSDSAYSPATGKTYTFACDNDGTDTLYCGSDGTSTSIQHGGSLAW